MDKATDPSNKKEPDTLPHIAVITINATINKKLPNGQYHPRAVHNDAFSLRIHGDTLEDCVDKLKAKLNKIKDS
jgi:hypothetical protein